MNSILVTTSTFSEMDDETRSLFEQLEFRLVRNPFGRQLSEEELLDLLFEHRPKGVLAGLETFSKRVFDHAKEFLQVISRVGTGIDNIDLQAAKTHNIQIYRTADAVTPAVVELTIGLIFDLARRISYHDRLLKQGHWKKSFGTLVSGKVFGVVGCGRIGKQICLHMRNLGCNIQGFDASADNSWFEENNIKRTINLEELVATSDILSIHVSFDVNTKNLINEHLISKMKPGAYLINTSRGGIVDETALFNALKSEKMAGAALDVFGEEPYKGSLANLDNVVLTPHIGSYAKETRVRMEREAIDNLLLGLGAIS